MLYKGHVVTKFDCIISNDYLIPTHALFPYFAYRKVLCIRCTSYTKICRLKKGIFFKTQLYRHFAARFKPLYFIHECILYARLYGKHHMLQKCGESDVLVITIESVSILDNYLQMMIYFGSHSHGLGE